MASACSVAVAIDPKGAGSDFLRTPAATTCILVTVSFICTCFLVVCGVLIVREYSLAAKYDSTECHLKNVSYLSRDVSCTYCAGFKDKNKDKGVSPCTPSQFPCVRITVSYELKGMLKEALMHPDSLQANGPFGQSKNTFEASVLHQNLARKKTNELVILSKKYVSTSHR
ncbi:hypothetical protein HELRODRAFT_162325 [Helobdella robusta]|uniref:Uncharacterized protein n=1 Tax=Helobdella robusta TaxID=6412 RepID=T1ESI2_HELRO|nr:hypothetical protein HELRODRAFT_162325 [Helobdella robusta]ESN98864.1 hypothetical protein HELRODRAFT_162325 [Helobdella robusta]